MRAVHFYGDKIMQKLKYTSMLLLLCTLSCAPLQSDSSIYQKISFEEIQDVWIAVDTAKYLFIKMDLKPDGQGEIFWAFPKSEKHTFVINRIELKRNKIKLSIKTDEDEGLIFKGNYDKFTDSLILKIESFDFSLRFLRASQLPMCL